MGIIINRKSHDCICNRDRVGGDEGNRTPVRKNLAKGFSERSWCFKSPSVHRPSTGYALWQLLSCDRVRSAPLFTFTSNRRPLHSRGTLCRNEHRAGKDAEGKTGSAPQLAYQGLKSPSKPLHPHIQFKNFILKTCIQRQAYQAFFHSRQDNIQCALCSAQSVNISQPISNCFRLNYLLLKQQLRHRLPIRPYP